jgi:hypothetical protein
MEAAKRPSMACFLEKSAQRPIHFSLLYCAAANSVIYFSVHEEERRRGRWNVAEMRGLSYAAK